MKNIVIIGAGDLGKELVWLIEDINKKQPTYLILGFLDDDLSKDTYSFCGYRVLGGTEKLEELNAKSSFSAVMAIRDGSVRRRIAEDHRSFDAWETIIHPTAVIASSAKIGKGCIFFPQTTVSVDTYLGDFGLYYIHSSVCNNVWINNYSSLMANVTVSEYADIGNECLITSGKCIEPHQKIESGTIV